MLPGSTVMHCWNVRGPVWRAGHLYHGAKSAVKRPRWAAPARRLHKPPFAAEELVARMEHGFERRTGRGASGSCAPTTWCWTCQPHRPVRMVVSLWELRRLEYDLLELFDAHAARRSTATMYERVWGGIPDTESLRTVDTHIARLRKKKSRLDGQDRDGVQDRASVEEGRLNRERQSPGCSFFWQQKKEPKKTCRCFRRSDHPRLVLHFKTPSGGAGAKRKQYYFFVLTPPRPSSTFESGFSRTPAARPLRQRGCHRAW